MACGTLLVAGCARPTSGNAPTAPRHPGTVITQERIAASGAKTAWDAIRLTVPNIQLRESRGKAARIQRRGRASIYLDDQVRVIVDNVRLEDIQALQQMPASDIVTIQLFTGLEATTYYGGTSTSGVILITTNHGS
jgi:outer membrane receptor for ferrienterochelin and colicin